MKLLLFAILITGFALDCNWDTQYLYYGKCVESNCVDEMVGTLKTLTSFGPYIDGQPTQFAVRSNYTAGVGFFITLSYQDGENNQWMLQDRSNCVDFSVYQRSDGTVNSKRISINTNKSPDGTTPTWPFSAYNQDQEAYQAYITVSFTADEVAQKCTKSGINQYTCYFELAFTVSGKTQSSNFFSLQITLNGLQSSTKLDVNPMVNVAPTSTLQVTVNTQAKIYTVLNRDNTTGAAATQVVLGNSYYVEHTISDDAYSKWYITNPTVFLNGTNLVKKAKFQIVVQTPGRNVYKLTASLVESAIPLTVTGTLSASLSSSQRLLSDDETSYTSKVYTKAPIVVTDTVNSTAKVSTNQNFKVAVKKVKVGSLVFIKVSLGAEYKQYSMKGIKVLQYSKTTGPKFIATNFKGYTIFMISATKSLSNQQLVITATVPTPQKVSGVNIIVNFPTVVN